MKMTEVSVKVERLVALPKYENIKYSCEVTATIADHETPTEVYEQCLAFCQDKIKQELVRMSKDLPPKPYKPNLQDEAIGFTAQPK